VLRVRVLGHLEGGARVIALSATVARVLAAMVVMPTWYQDLDETPEQRADLLRPAALAIANATDDRTEQAAMVALGWHESRWSRYVIEGRCADGPKGARCDNGRARSPWQVHAYGICRAAWAYAEDDPRTLEAAASCAVRYLRGAKSRCAGQHPAGDWAGAFSQYGTGARCTRPKSAERVRTMQTVMLRLYP